MQVLGTFGTRDQADAIKDAFEKEGFAAHDLIVMVNREQEQPPEDAILEVGDEGAHGLAGVEEKIGKAVLGFMHKENAVDGDMTEGTGTGGALLAVTVPDQAGVERAKALMQRHFVSDIEIVGEPESSPATQDATMGHSDIKPDISTHDPIEVGGIAQPKKADDTENVEVKSSQGDE